MRESPDLRAPGPFKRAKKFAPKPVRPPLAHRVLRYLLAFVAVVIIIDGLFGEQGLVDTVRARQEYAALEAHVARVRLENARLREEARRLKEEPDDIEAIARRELGLIKRGETVFIVSDRTRTHRGK